ncbi:hypothetical protein JJC04_03995 [Flavobacterium covae]|nr:hypothetical protein [Flavobacterium covae]QYS91851.1 hypothetical protein JJC04_03995 [Flavobacterium covae]
MQINNKQLLEFKNFKENTYNDPKAHTLGNHIVGNIAFLERIKKKLEDYTFNGGMPFGFIEYKEPATIYETDASKASVNKEREEREKQKEEEINKDIRFLRNHYLHWNATYGSSGIDLLVEKDYPNIINGKKKKKCILN